MGEPAVGVGDCECTVNAKPGTFPFFFLFSFLPCVFLVVSCVCMHLCGPSQVISLQCNNLPTISMISELSACYGKMKISRPADGTDISDTRRLAGSIRRCVVIERDEDDWPSFSLRFGKVSPPEGQAGATLQRAALEICIKVASLHSLSTVVTYIHGMGGTRWMDGWRPFPTTRYLAPYLL